MIYCDSKIAEFIEIGLFRLYSHIRVWGYIFNLTWRCLSFQGEAKKKSQYVCDLGIEAVVFCLHVYSQNKAISISGGIIVSKEIKT